MPSLRRATPEDAEAIASVHVKSWRWAYRGQLPDSHLDSLSVLERSDMWREALTKPQPKEGVVVAEEQGQIVGFVGFGPPHQESEPEGTGEVYAIYLAEPAVGKGIGRGLMAAAQEHLKASGFSRAMLWVLESNDRARGFYERGGWVWDGTVGDHLIECANYPIVRYARDL